jgi:hypothetical protein
MSFWARDLRTGLDPDLGNGERQTALIWEFERVPGSIVVFGAVNGHDSTYEGSSNCKLFSQLSPFAPPYDGLHNISGFGCGLIEHANVIRRTFPIEFLITVVVTLTSENSIYSGPYGG